MQCFGFLMQFIFKQNIYNNFTFTRIWFVHFMVVHNANETTVNSLNYVILCKETIHLFIIHPGKDKTSLLRGWGPLKILLIILGRGPYTFEFWEALLAILNILCFETHILISKFRMDSMHIGTLNHLLNCFIQKHLPYSFSNKTHHCCCVLHATAASAAVPSFGNILAEKKMTITV